MDFDTAIFIIVSIAVILDFAIMGFKVLTISKQAKDSDKAFIGGIGKLLLTVSVTHLFWLVIVMAGPALRIDDYPIARHGVTVIFVVMGLASIVGRHKWWVGTIAPALNGYYKKDDDGKA